VIALPRDRPSFALAISPGAIVLCREAAFLFDDLIDASEQH